MTITEKIVESLKMAFPEASGVDEETGEDNQQVLGQAIGEPVEEEVQRIDEVDAVQNESLTEHISEIAFIKAQIDAIITNDPVPLGGPPDGIPPSTGSIEAETTSKIPSVPDGAFPTRGTAEAIAIDHSAHVVVERLKTGNTKFTLWPTVDEYKNIVEESLRRYINGIHYVPPGPGPGSNPQINHKTFVINAIVTKATTLLRQERY